MRRIHIEGVLDEVFHSAKIVAFVGRRPPKLPERPFCVFFVNGGSDETRVTETARVELEGWGRTLAEAWGVLDFAEGAVLEAVGGYGIRQARSVTKPVALATDVRGWERYTMAVEIAHRPNVERLKQ